jgi:hypothetical protein
MSTLRNMNTGIVENHMRFNPMAKAIVIKEFKPQEGA